MGGVSIVTEFTYHNMYIPVFQQEIEFHSITSEERQYEKNKVGIYLAIYLEPIWGDSIKLGLDWDTFTDLVRKVYKTLLDLSDDQLSELFNEGDPPSIKLEEKGENNDN